MVAAGFVRAAKYQDITQNGGRYAAGSVQTKQVPSACSGQALRLGRESVSRPRSGWHAVRQQCRKWV